MSEADISVTIEAVDLTTVPFEKIQELFNEWRSLALQEREQRITLQLAVEYLKLEAELERCLTCRHWGGKVDDGSTYACRVSGSFTAPGGLFTEATFGCAHYSKAET